MRKKLPRDLQGIVLCSSTTRYLLDRNIADGVFSQVIGAVDLRTSQEVVVKLLKNNAHVDREITMLEAVRGHDPAHLVEYKENFEFCGETFLVFERLDIHLYHLLNQQNRPLTLNQIRPICYQLLGALISLKRLGVVHADIKPDNIMLVNHLIEPFKVKLIDFDLSFLTWDVELGAIIQPLEYRAPEVTLGLPITGAIDMWSLGCVLLYLYLGNQLFRPCEYHTIKAVIDILGQPDDDLLSSGVHTRNFFKKDKNWCKPDWSLKTPGEYQSTTGIRPLLKTPQIRCLHDLITLYPVTHGSNEVCDRRAFVSLIRGLMEVDPSKRMTPEKALTHPFLTMLHLMGNGMKYLTDAVDKMEVLGVDIDDVSTDDVTDREHDSSIQFHPDPDLDISWFNKLRCLVRDIRGVFGRLTSRIF